MRRHVSTRQILVIKGLLVAILFFIVVSGEVPFVKATSSTSISSSYITITVGTNGTYTVVAQTPAWTFGGNIRHPLTNIVVNTGSDTIGSYQEIDFTYQDQTLASRGGGIRNYDNKPVVLFIEV